MPRTDDGRESTFLDVGLVDRQDPLARRGGHGRGRRIPADSSISIGSNTRRRWKSAEEQAGRGLDPLPWCRLRKAPRC